MPCQKYTRDLIVGQTPKIYSDISLPIGVKKFQIWPRFSTSITFDGLWLQNGNLSET